MRRGTLDIFEIVRVIIARNLDIDPEAIELDFQFHHFIDMLASHRQKQSGIEDLRDYLEAANIYIELSETFDLHFFADFTDCACITVDDLVNLIDSKLDSLV
jgi:hypothetical protein